MSVRTIVIVLTALFVLGLGDYSTKKWSLSGGGGSLLLAAGCYSIVTATWFYIMWTKSELGRLGTIWATTSMVMSLVVASYFFGEHLTSANKVGVILCILGVVLASL